MSQRARTYRRAGKIVLGLYEALQPQVDAQVEKYGPSTCKEGCAHCCRLLAISGPHEMAPVVEYLTARTDWPAIRAELLRDIRAHLAVIAQTGISDEDDHPSRLAYWMRQVPCVFLRNERCMIYPVRPSVCRYHVMTTPPERCDAAREDPHGQMDLARVDLRPVEIEIAKVAAETGEIIATTIAGAFVYACRALGVDFPIDNRLLLPATLLHARLA